MQMIRILKAQGRRPDLPKAGHSPLLLGFCPAAEIAACCFLSETKRLSPSELQPRCICFYGGDSGKTFLQSFLAHFGCSWDVRIRPIWIFQCKAQKKNPGTTDFQTSYNRLCTLRSTQMFHKFFV